MKFDAAGDTITGYKAGDTTNEKTERTNDALTNASKSASNTDFKAKEIIVGKLNVLYIATDESETGNSRNNNRGHYRQSCE